MPQLNPALISVAMLILAITLGISVFRRRMILAGFSPVRRDILKTCKLVNAEPSREGEDVVLNGDYAGHPVRIDFSNSDNVSALRVSMAIPSTFQFSMVPRSAANRRQGKTIVRIEDPVLNRGFVLSSDQPAEAKIFAEGREVREILKAIGSSRVFVSAVPGAMTIHDLEFPATGLAEVVLHHLEHMARLEGKFHAMPGADRITIAPFKKQRKIASRVIVAVALVIGIIGAVRLTQSRTDPDIAAGASASASAPAGVLPSDVGVIAALKGWRLATESDFDPGLSAWLHDQNIVPGGKIVADFSGTTNGQDRAYILVNENGLARVVVISQGRTVSDFAYRHLAAVARVPAGVIPGIAWRAPILGPADGDGLLIVPDATDPSSASVLVLSSGKAIAALPENYKNLVLGGF
ncbi:MAG TPA: hypothetical protein VKT33_14205 [Candidatus Angelobacter sp.]|nr:hypothetical protein [Candidatus Angelobacter sp.]